MRAYKCALQKAKPSNHRWAQAYNDRQLELERNFSWDSLTQIEVQLWADHDSTYAYIAMHQSIPDKICFLILLHIFSYLAPNIASALTLRYYDSSHQSPELFLYDIAPKLAFRRWELCILGVNHNEIDNIAVLMKNVPHYQSTPFNICLESLTTRTPRLHSQSGQL